MLYKVISSMLEDEIIVEAQNSSQAKRKACKLWGISPSDPWHGISTMQAKKLTVREVEEYEKKWR